MEPQYMIVRTNILLVSTIHEDCQCVQHISLYLLENIMIYRVSLILSQVLNILFRNNLRI